MQVFEHRMHTAIQQTLERFLVAGELEKVFPGECAVLVRELPVLLEQAAQLGHVELCSGLLSCNTFCFLEIRCKVHVNRMVIMLQRKARV